MLLLTKLFHKLLVVSNFSTFISAFFLVKCSPEFAEQLCATAIGGADDSDVLFCE